MRDPFDEAFDRCWGEPTREIDPALLAHLRAACAVPLGRETTRDKVVVSVNVARRRGA